MSAASPSNLRVATAVERALGERLRACKLDVESALPPLWLELVAKIEDAAASDRSKAGAETGLDFA